MWDGLIKAFLESTNPAAQLPSCFLPHDGTSNTHRATIPYKVVPLSYEV